MEQKRRAGRGHAAHHGGGSHWQGATGPLLQRRVCGKVHWRAWRQRQTGYACFAAVGCRYLHGTRHVWATSLKNSDDAVVAAGVRATVMGTVMTLMKG